MSTPRYVDSGGGDDDPFIIISAKLRASSIAGVDSLESRLPTGESKNSHTRDESRNTETLWTVDVGEMIPLAERAAAVTTPGVGAILPRHPTQR